MNQEQRDLLSMMPNEIALGRSHLVMIERGLRDIDNSQHLLTHVEKVKDHLNQLANQHRRITGLTPPAAVARQAAKGAKR